MSVATLLPLAAPVVNPPSAAECLQAALANERAGEIADAVAGYDVAIVFAEQQQDRAVLAESLRRVAVLRHRRDEVAVAQALALRSLAVARDMSNDVLAAEALNTLGLMELVSGSLDEARVRFLEAMELGGESRALRAGVGQNLGILANIRGDHDDARRWYQRSFEAYQSVGDEKGCAVAFHNLGMLSADREEYEQAERQFIQSREIARRAGDAYLEGLCLVNNADVLTARQRYDDARQEAEEALAIFEKIGARRDKSDAYRVLGVVYRETSRLGLAESRLKAAVEQATASASVLHEGEARRELAVLYQMMGRNQEALSLLGAAHRLFHRLNARVDLVNVDAKVQQLENTYRAVVREWGESIESSDSYTFGHCERVAGYAVALAQALGLDETAQTTIQLGAYLHDVGKVKVPHEILNKTGRLTSEELAVIQMHPVWGMELLAAVEFPWDLKPIIRWHHEKYDGSGYPDRLRGEEIPLSAQIVGIVDVFDALTTTRSYRPAMSSTEALAEMTRMRTSWSERVFDAFCRVVREQPELDRAA